jgi:tRNA G18 (ribose-2'-O)-methylase SpoU
MDNNYNVLDKYRAWTLDLIREDVARNTFGYAVLMQCINGDFNIGTVIRNSNAFGAEGLYYIGQKKIDKRSTVGTHHYTPVQFLDSMEQVKALKERYAFVALECGIDSVAMPNFVWPKNPLIIVGEETAGINQELLDLCDHKVNIPMFGSVRSLNVGTAAGIAMNDFVTKLRPASVV